MMALGLTKSLSNSVRLPLPSRFALSIMSGFESTQNICLRLTSTAKPSGLTRSTERRGNTLKIVDIALFQVDDVDKVVMVSLFTCVDEDFRLSSRRHRSSVDGSCRQIRPVDSVLFAVMGNTNDYRALETDTYIYLKHAFSF